MTSCGAAHGVRPAATRARHCNIRAGLIASLAFSRFRPNYPLGTELAPLPTKLVPISSARLNSLLDCSRWDSDFAPAGAVYGVAWIALISV